MLMHLHVILFEQICGFQILNIVSMWIVHKFVHPQWCSRAISSHSRKTLPLLMSSWHYHTILYPHLLSPPNGGSMMKMISLNDDEKLMIIIKILRNPNEVCKFTICSMFD
jgi:hypothetical protein